MTLRAKSSSDKESVTSYCLQLYKDVEMVNVINKTVGEIYIEKYRLATMD